MIKPRVRITEDVKARVLELKRTNSYTTTARLTGVPLGTVKTIVRRSGQQQDNELHRAFFTLPPVQCSDSTSLAIVDMPPQQVVTGDKEVDAVLWLRELIETGNAAYIDKALLAIKQIKTPAKQLESRYSQWLLKGNAEMGMFAVMQSMGFADLERFAAKVLADQKLAHEFLSRFGAEAEYNPSYIERRFVNLLDGLGHDDIEGYTARLNDCPDLLPATLADCVHELEYWDRYFLLCESVSNVSEACSMRNTYIHSLLTTIRPRSAEESRHVLEYLIRSELLHESWFEADDVLRNLLNV